MGDVEDMIGELEDEDETEEEASKDEKDQEEAEEETFGLDLDSAWSSPERGED